jgi:hypothetical protein
MGADVPAKHPRAENRRRSRRRKSTVRYHLHIAAQADPSIRAENQAAAGPPVRPSGAGLRNMEDLITLYTTEGRFPSTKGSKPRERTLAVWLQRRLQDANQGALSPSIGKA